MTLSVAVLALFDGGATDVCGHQWVGEVGV